MRTCWPVPTVAAVSASCVLGKPGEQMLLGPRVAWTHVSRGVAARSWGPLRSSWTRWPPSPRTTGATQAARAATRWEPPGEVALPGCPPRGGPQRQQGSRPPAQTQVALPCQAVTPSSPAPGTTACDPTFRAWREADGRREPRATGMTPRPWPPERTRPPHLDSHLGLPGCGRGLRGGSGDRGPGLRDGRCRAEVHSRPPVSLGPREPQLGRGRQGAPSPFW